MFSSLESVLTMLTLKFRPAAFSEEKVRFLSGRESLKSFRNEIKQNVCCQGCVNLAASPRDAMGEI